MYDHHYETEILAVLRVLKYIHLTDKNKFQSVLSFAQQLSLYECEEILLNVMWEVFDSSLFSYDEETEIETVTIEDPLFDAYLAESEAFCKGISAGIMASHQQRFQDLFEFHICGVTNSIYDLHYSYEEGHVAVTLWLSPDCYEPFYLAGGIVDLMLDLRKKLAVLEEANRKEQRNYA